MKQFNAEQNTRKTRFDVTLLINGLPLVQIELKRRGLGLKEAFNQIDRYHRDAFWVGSGLFQYVQILLSATAWTPNTTPTTAPTISSRPSSGPMKK